MGQMGLSFGELQATIVKDLQDRQLGVLATAQGTHVTARQMRLVPNGPKIYCFTYLGDRKHKQIAANPNVAMSAGNIQIEGVPSLKRHPLAAENADFIQVYGFSQPENLQRSLDRNFGDPRCIVLEINPTRVARYNQGNATAGSWYVEILDVTDTKPHQIGGDD